MRLRVLVVAGLLAVSGCSDSPSQPGVLSVGLREPATLVPAEVHDQAGRLIVNALWTPLVDYDAANGKVTPRAAESIESTDQVNWTVKLRAGGRFHDGSPVTAKSYVDTWKRWTLPEVLHAKDITATADLTIKITLDQPFGQMPAVLSSPALVPVPASVDWKNPIGNGPYKLAAPWKPGSGGRLVRVADAPGKAKEIDLRVGDPTTQYDEVKAGRLDLATEVPGDRHDAMHTDFADRHAVWPLPEVTYLGFPLTDKRFQDSTVRHGFALGVDRAALEAGPLAHQVDPARALLPPAVAPLERTGPCRPCTFDAAAGKALLGQAGFTGDANVYLAEPWGQPLSKQLHDALGVGVTPKTRTGDAPVDGPFALSLSLKTPSPHEVLAAIAKSTGYSDDGFTQLLATADSATTADDSARMYRLTENQLLRDLPVAPLWSGHGHAVWSTRVRDFTATTFGGIALVTLSVS